MLWAPIASAQARAFGSRIARRAVSEDDAEEITRKYGLEAGLFSVFKSKDTEGKGIKAKDLLAKYGSAYLITSISLSIVSFGLCYALINAGVDVGALLSKVRSAGLCCFVCGDCRKGAQHDVLYHHLVASGYPVPHAELLAELRRSVSWYKWSTQI